MSEGPIQRWRDAHKPHLVSTPDAHRVCAPGEPGRSYCGRKDFPTEVWGKVTCADCHAARRADEEAT